MLRDDLIVGYDRSVLSARLIAKKQTRQEPHTLATRRNSFLPLPSPPANHTDLSRATLSVLSHKDDDMHPWSRLPKNSHVLCHHTHLPWESRHTVLTATPPSHFIVPAFVSKTLRAQPHSSGSVINVTWLAGWSRCTHRELPVHHTNGWQSRLLEIVGFAEAGRTHLSVLGFVSSKVRPPALPPRTVLSFFFFAHANEIDNLSDKEPREGHVLLTTGCNSGIGALHLHIRAREKSSRTLSADTVMYRHVCSSHKRTLRQLEVAPRLVAVAQARFRRVPSSP